MSHYMPKHFGLYEFVPPAQYRALGNRSIILLDYRILKTADMVREWFGVPVTINNWKWGKPRRFSGWRPPWYRCARYSQHFAGRAIDIQVKGLRASRIRREILDNYRHFLYITAIERGTPTWTHLDCRCSGRNNGIILVNP